LTPAVFGDFLGAGRQHLEAAVAGRDRQDACLPAVAPPLHRLVTIMSVYLEDLAPCDDIEAAGRTDLHVWERAVIDTGAALRIAADCLHRSAADLTASEPVSEPAPYRARRLADAATELMAGRDLLYTHVVLGPDRLVQERSEWAPVVTSLPVTRAISNEIAVWSARLAPFTAWLAGLATPHISRRLTDQLFALSPREELASASQWLRAAGAALRPALDADPMRAVDAQLLRAIPAAAPPHRQPLGPAAESITELCHGIAVSASRLRAAAHRGRDRVSWSPDVTSGGWQWIAQAAAITTHLSELALRSLATRAGRLPSLPVTEAQLQGAADAMIGMRAAWQQVDLTWNTIITEQRLLPTLAMSEAGDLLLRMGRLVWDNPQWTPARAHRGPRRSPAALAPGEAAFTAVLSATHQAADALARVAATDSTTVQAAARAGRLYMPTRSLPEGYDVPRPFAPALVETVLELQDTYHSAAEASTQAARELDEIAIAVAAPSKALALARAAAVVQTRRRGGQETWPDNDTSHDLPRSDVSFRDSRASTGLPGPVERAVRRRRVDDPVILLRAAAIDNAARDLIGLPANADIPSRSGIQETAGSAPQVHDAVQLSAQSFPHDPILTQPVNASRPGMSSASGPLSDRTRLRNN
jgi:hypothetical protein